MTTSNDETLSATDSRLLAEALRRVRDGRGSRDRDCDSDTIQRALIDALRRGRRDLFSLVKAGQRALDN